MSKIDRRHQARQKQQSKRQEHEKATSIFSGHNGAPRNVAVVPLSPDSDSAAAIQKLLESLDQDVNTRIQEPTSIRVDRFKQTIRFIPTQRELFGVFDACKVADFILFILSPDENVDEAGEQLLRAVESQGVSNVLTVVERINSIEPSKKRPQIISSLKSYISHFLPNQDKIHSLDSHQDCANIIRSLCTITPKGVRWREDRSWMLVEEVRWPSDGHTDDQTHGGVILTGVVRGKGLKADRLVQIGDWGTFQIEQITAAALPGHKKRKADQMAVDDPNEIIVLDQPGHDQDDLGSLSPGDVDMGDANEAPASEAPSERRGVLLDDHHYFSDDETHLPEAPKRLPKGTSTYQAAWFLGDMSDSGSDSDDATEIRSDTAMPIDPPALPQDGLEGLDSNTQVDPTEVGASEYPQSDMFLDPSPNEEAEELAAYRSQRKHEAKDDLEFPDEIELHPNVLARERLARYRGLKSLRTSKWETEEDRAHEPEEWNRLLQMVNYKKAKSQVMREALVGGAPAGSRVEIYIRNVPLSFRSSSSSGLLTAFSLLRHENKRVVMNFSITLRSDYEGTIKSKEELIMQCGPRRFVIHPLFSHAGSTPNNVHKFNRYIHPGQTAMATFLAPLTWGSVPTLFFQRASPSTSPDSNQDLVLVGTGTSQPPDRSRVIAKRIILTGHPYKIHKKLVTIRYMFFNTEDVRWFKALPLWTRRGRSGYVKESLGTHGYFKATFDGRINAQDAVGVSLYKRVFPRMAVLWRGRRDRADEADEANGGEGGRRKDR